MRPRRDPGDCIICGVAHCACGGGAPITVVQLPARDAGTRVASPHPPLGTEAAAAALADDGGPLGDGSDGRSFSTRTYRGKKKRR